MITIRPVIIALLSLITSIGPTVAFADTRLPEQTNAEGGVTVKVTPTAIDSNAKVWRFAVVFDTRAGALTGDPAHFAVLVDSRGAKQAPLNWKGDPPGGHHRKGVLQFPAPDQKVGTIELHLMNVGGIPERAFRWQMTEPTEE